ncbi:MAG: hypothetical protein IPP90_20900 [Gemmatimonadaceae bacterium]|nr:hypothetical protein [Gemmatimonadaceae bacterium]
MKQWPMVVYFYEKLTDGLRTRPVWRRQDAMWWSTQVYNARPATSCFEPDIIYTDGRGGLSAAKAIISGRAGAD